MAPQHAATHVSRLDLWLAAAMGMDPALRRFLARGGVEQHTAADVRRAAAAAGISERCPTTPALIVEFFGPPVVARRDRLVYDLVLWPAHQFIWAISRWGDAGPVGLRLRETLPVMPMRADADLEWVRAHLRPWHHTEHEVRCALGPADRVAGAGASSKWLYLRPAGRLCLQFAFSWGLLLEISMRPAPVGMLGRGPARSPARAPVAPYLWPGRTSRRRRG